MDELTEIMRLFSKMQQDARKQTVFISATELENAVHAAAEFGTDQFFLIGSETGLGTKIDLVPLDESNEPIEGKSKDITDYSVW